MDNKEKILDCALELFSNKGYDAVGVQEIVNEVGITKPTLYHYFGSKEGLLQSLLNVKHEDLLRRISHAAAYKGDLPLAMYQLTKAYFNYAKEHRTFYRMLLAMRFYPPASDGYKVARPLINEQIQVLEELFAKASMHHGNMKGRQRTYAITYLGMVNAYIELQDNEDYLVEENLIRKATHQFMHGIFS